MKIPAALVSNLVLILASAQGAGGAAAEFPKRRPGLWELTTVTQDSKRPPRTSRFCLDAATDAMLMQNAVGADPKDCSKQNVDVHGSQAVVHSTCTIMGHQVTTEATIVYQGDIAVHMQIHSRYSPPLFGTGTSSVQQEARWLGACGADMQPGDVLLPGGVKTNILKLGAGR